MHCVASHNKICYDRKISFRQLESWIFRTSEMGKAQSLTPPSLIQSSGLRGQRLSSRHQDEVEKAEIIKNQAAQAGD